MRASYMLWIWHWQFHVNAFGKNLRKIEEGDIQRMRLPKYSPSCSLEVIFSIFHPPYVRIWGLLHKNKVRKLDSIPDNYLKKLNEKSAPCNINNERQKSRWSFFTHRANKTTNYFSKLTNPILHSRKTINQKGK